MSTDSGGQAGFTMQAVDEFTLEIAPDRASQFDTLLHRGRTVADVEARVVEAQFRRADGSTVLLLNDDTPFKEKLTILLMGPALQVLDRLEVGGAFTPGYLSGVFPMGPDELAYCWHDLDQTVTVARHRSRFGRVRWLSVRDVMAERPRAAQKREARRRRQNPIPSLVAAAMLTLRLWPNRWSARRALQPVPVQGGKAARQNGAAVNLTPRPPGRGRE